MAGIFYETGYFPAPDITDTIIAKNRGYKLKRYSDRDERIDAAVVRSVFADLHAQGYTHVANMPCRLTDICYNARCFHIIVVDRRLVRRIAALCASLTEETLLPPAVPSR